MAHAYIITNELFNVKQYLQLLLNIFFFIYSFQYLQLYCFTKIESAFLRGFCYNYTIMAVKPIDPDKIERGDILLVHTKRSFISFLIRKFTKSYWNHVGIFVSKKDQWPKWVIEALPEGIVGRPFELKYLKVIRGDRGRILKINPSKKFHIAIVRAKNLNYQQRKQISGKAYQWALEERGYDFLLLILGMLLHLLTFRKFRPRWLNIKSRFICSELISVAFGEIAGIVFGKYTASGFVTPADIAFCAQTKDELEIIMSNAKEKD